MENSENNIVSEAVFLQHTMTELKTLEQAAQTHYHGVLAHAISAARQETEFLLRQETEARTRSRPAEPSPYGIR